MGNTVDPSHLLVHQGSDKPNVEKKGDSETMEHKELECQSDSKFWDSKHRRQLVFFFPLATVMFAINLEVPCCRWSKA